MPKLCPLPPSQGVAAMEGALAQRVRATQRLVALSLIHRNAEGEVAPSGGPHKNSSQSLRRGSGNCLSVGIGDWGKERKSPLLCGWAFFRYRLTVLERSDPTPPSNENIETILKKTCCGNTLFNE